MDVSVSLLLSVLCDFYVYVCVYACVCVISDQSTSKKLHYVSDLSKLDTILHKHTAISRYQCSICVDP